MKTEVLIELIQIAFKYGYPVVCKILKDINKETITNEDIAFLLKGIKAPEEYFK